MGLSSSKAVKKEDDSTVVPEEEDYVNVTMPPVLQEVQRSSSSKKIVQMFRDFLDELRGLKEPIDCQQAYCINKLNLDDELIARLVGLFENAHERYSEMYPRNGFLSKGFVTYKLLEHVDSLERFKMLNYLPRTEKKMQLFNERWSIISNTLSEIKS